MPIDSKALLSREFTDVISRYTEKDTMLYALGVGVGIDQPATGDEDLQFVYEDGLQVLPTMSVVLGHPGFWMREPDTGIDWIKVLHVGQRIEMHRPLAANGTVRSKCYVSEIVDLGEKKGALITYVRNLEDAETGEKICSISQTALARGDGGFGNPPTSKAKKIVNPDRKPDVTVDLKTGFQTALIYRLSGDYNPLHAVPAIAAKAGFHRPILHGLSTFGIAGRAIIKGCCDNKAERLKSLDVRFSSPVYPGETIRTQMWKLQNGEVSFRCQAVERDETVVLKQGVAFIEKTA